MDKRRIGPRFTRITRMESPRFESFVWFTGNAFRSLVAGTNAFLKETAACKIPVASAQVVEHPASGNDKWMCFLERVALAEVQFTKIFVYKAVEPLFLARPTRVTE